MNETTTTKKSEFVFRRLSDSFDQFAVDILGTALGNIISLGLLALAVIVVLVRIVYRYAGPARAPGVKDPVATALKIATWLSVGALIAWDLFVFYGLDGDQTRAAEAVSSLGAGNALKWYVFTGTVFALGTVFVVLMYIQDTRTARWYLALPLGLLRITVYAILCAVFLLPAMQTYEDTNKQSRVVVLLDISPSMGVTDEVGGGPGRKPKTRTDLVLDLLTDENVALIKKLLDKNPVAVYTFGTRLDESPRMIAADQPAWTRSDWDALAKYDFKPYVLRGLSDEGKEQLKKSADWNGDKTGDINWAGTWNARKKDDLQTTVGLSDPADAAALKKNLENLDKRIDVARTITQGTDVADSISAAIDRESANMVQGIIVFSDGRSNLGSESGLAKLRERATREKIPVFTITVGEDRQSAAIVITDLTAPDSAPIDEAWKVVVEADGLNLAGKETDVFLDLWLPGRDMKKVGADHTLAAKLTFAPGDPPHGQVEFEIDPTKLPDNLTEDSKDAAIKKRVLKEGKWSVRARIPKDPQEAFADAEHIRDRPGIDVVQQKLRVLLVAGAPVREFTFLRTLLVREVQDKRATLTTYVQNEAGTTNKLTAEEGEAIIVKFPNRFDLSNKAVDPLEKPYNLNEYDVIIAFDPDWSELSETQGEDLARWVKEGGGGLIFAAGPINTHRLVPGKEVGERLKKVLEILPVVPADIAAVRFKPTPKTPRRLYLHPEKVLTADLLKLDDKVPDDRAAGWERFFTDRDKYAPSGDRQIELFPKRGFFSCYPVETVKSDAVLAEFVDENDAKEIVKYPWIVVNNPTAPYRTAFLASPEFHKLRAFEPDTGAGREFFERFWIKLIKYTAAKRNVKAPRGRLLVGKEGVSGMPLRVQARILNESAKPYPAGTASPKFRIEQYENGAKKRDRGPFPLVEKANASGFDGYYAGQELLDPNEYPTGDYVYRVVVEIPDSNGETLNGEFGIRKSNPEMDNTKPDFPAMLRIASDFYTDFQERVPGDKVKREFGSELPKEGPMPKLAFKISDRKLLPQIPDCMTTVKTTSQNRGPVRDLWDHKANFQLTPERTKELLFNLLCCAAGILILRAIWGSLAPVLPDWLRVTTVVVYLLGNVGALAFLSLWAWLPPDSWPESLRMEPLDWLIWLLWCGLFVAGVLAIASPWRLAAPIAGALVAAAGTVYLVTRCWDVYEQPALVSVVLLVLVAILSVEWISRKMLRLA